MKSARARFPLRGLSLVVLLVLAGGSALGSAFARRALADQEHRLLNQRAGEAAALITNLFVQSQASTRSLAAVVSATGADAADFAAAAGRDPAFAGATATVALVRLDGDGGHFRVTAVRGPGLTPGQDLDGPAAVLTQRARSTADVVTSEIFGAAAGSRRMASALRVDAASDSPLIYREYVLPAPGQRRQLTATQPFGEIETVLYAGPRADPAQVVLATRALPLPGPTVRQTVAVGPDHWLLLVAANRPLVGGMAAKEPWLLLFRGLVAALLITALVEVLSRRRSYALALVDERTAVLREQEQQFRDLLEMAPDGIVIVDGGGRIVLVNRQTEALFGWSRDQLIGQKIEMLLPDRFAQRHAQHRRAFSADSTMRPMGAGLDLYARRADGSEFPVEISLSPLRTEHGVLVSAAVRDVSDRKQAQLQLAHQAAHDALTGLPNRLLVGERLEQALARAVRLRSEVAVLFVDIDRFKLINDSRGHAAGDALLITVADRLRQAVRVEDVVARFGGDEFVVVCEDHSAAFQATRVADRILEVLREPVVADGQELFLSASVGVAVSDGTDSPESLLADADAAMYRAKEKGRARCEFFDATMRTEATEHLETQSALHRAVERDELRVHYQPVVDLESGATVGVEALVRWDHPQLGLVPPGSFIPLAEDTGLIVPVGAWVLEQATAQLARWRAGGLSGPLTVNVNLSARQLRQPDLIPALIAVLLESGVEPGALCLELTETTFMEDAASHRETLAGIRSLGVGLAIDDFGTGYSSLTYLKRFPVSVLKIDQAFVRGLGVDAADTAIVKSVIDLAHALGLVVVAEGVETADQVAHLRRLGCDQAQGYFFARPKPAADLDELLMPAARAL